MPLGNAGWNMHVMMPNYTLDDVDTKDNRQVAKTVTEIFNHIFPGADSSFIPGFFEDIKEMFDGKYINYQAMDTKYHDLDHTLQATLCWVRLVANRHSIKIEPRMSEKDFKIGMVAVLFHDIGYLKENDDKEGTGAKFTFVHERRSCEMADVYLTDLGWPKQDVFGVQHLISCTGPRSLIDSIPFTSKLERILGEAVCTADYIGQMSDRNYVNKLSALYLEFEESDDYRDVPQEQRLFKSSDELLRGTPFFWEKIVIKKLESDCHDLYKFLSVPYPDGENPYIAKIEENVDLVRSMIDSNKA